MNTGRVLAGWFTALRGRRRAQADPVIESPRQEPARIGVALGGGFARGIAHVGVLRVLERSDVPIHCIAGVSAGAIVAAAYASGTTPEEIAAIARTMRFADVARWTFPRMGFAGSERMVKFLHKLLKQHAFEEMRIPLGIVATDLVSGEPVLFRGRGDVCLPIRASCSYPGLFQPVRLLDRLLVDGAMSMELPAAMLRAMGATRVISVHLPMQGPGLPPQNMFQVVNRCFQIMQSRTERDWRAASDLVIAPDVRAMSWDAFHSADQLIAAGESAALDALPAIRSWLPSAPLAPSAPRPASVTKSAPTPAQQPSHA